MRRDSLAPVFVSTLLLFPLGVAQATICGSAAFNHDINWPSTSDLYYSVWNAPANTCGDLWAWRNGNGYNMEAANWICTDSWGQATKGPWSSSSHSTDETAYGYIDWHTCYSPVASHIWDVTPPDPSIDNTYPSSFSGSATDGSWGAGFVSSAYCQTEFYDATPGIGKWWSFSNNSYTATSPDYGPCFLSGKPSYYVTWYGSPLPSLQAGHHYYWKVLVWDALYGNQGIQTVDFWY